MQFLVATLVILTALNGTAAAAQAGTSQVGAAPPATPQAPIIEIVPLEKDQWFLVLSGNPNEEPLQVEIRKEGTMFKGWALSGPAPVDPGATRWSTAWKQVLGADVGEADLWPEALRRIGDQPLPDRVAMVEPDLRLVLRTAGEYPKYLSLVENHEINKKGSDGWEKVGDIDVDGALSIPPNKRNAIWNLIFKQSPPASNAWPQFWSSWIESARMDPSKHLHVYRGANGKLVRVVREREEADGQISVTKSDTQLGQTTSSTSTASGTSATTTPTESDWRSYLPYLGILALILAALAALRFRKQIEKRLLIWLARRFAPQDLPSLPELIERLHTAALQSLKHDPLDPELEVRPQALAFARNRMLTVAEAGTVALPVLQLPQADDKATARQKEEAALGRELLDALQKRGVKATIPLAQEFLTVLLGLEDQLASERQAAKRLEAEKQRIELDFETLQGQINEAKRKAREQQTEYTAFQAENADLKRVRKALEKREKELEAEIVREKNLRVDLQQKSQLWGNEKIKIEADLRANQQKYDQLNNRLTIVTGERNSFEQSAKKLQEQIEQEHREQETARADKRVLEEKLTRIRQASDYLRKTHLAYWDRCQHPASTAALLYNAYLGLFQLADGAARKDPLVETTGWMNLRNLLRRVGQIPGLETWEREFGRGVYPDIDVIQIPDAQIVDRNQQDKERTVQSTVLRSLLNGELQIGGMTGGRFDLNKLLGWPVFFKVENGRVWGAS